MTPKRPAKKAPAKAGAAGVRDLMRDYQLRECLSSARSGENLGIRRLHGFLAAAIREGELTEFARDVLASMHEAIELGEDPSAAMIATPPSGGRPPNAMRDWDLYVRMEDWIRHLKIAGEPVKMRELYAQAGKAFGISATRAKSIYLDRCRAVLPD